MSASLLELAGICKSYGEVQANRDVNLHLRCGEIHALLGENGAGKSTLVNILCGVVRPDAGTLTWQGKRVTLDTPATARELGIGVVFQHFSIFQALTVGDNIALGLGAMSSRELRTEIASVASRYGMEIEPDRPMHSLSVGEWQRVEIVRCLLSKPQLLVLDEPTSVLTPQETDALFTVLRKVAAQGCAVLYISHRLREIRDLCQRATIMRNGTVISECDPVAETPSSLATMMIGTQPVPPQRPKSNGDKSIGLSLQDIDFEPENVFGTQLRNINLQVRNGGVTAIAGVAGNGQQELAAVLAGAVLVAANKLVLGHQPIGQLKPDARRRAGLNFVPEQRIGHAAVGSLSMWENTCLTARHLGGMMKHGFLSRRKAESYSAEVIKRFDVRCAGPGAHANTLSGGNLQKFVLGRELSQTPKVLVIMQPTWGVDAGAAAMIHQVLLDLAAQGTAVLVISQDLNEVFTIADEVAVLCAGELSESIAVTELDVARLGLLMGGIQEMECAAA